jgi:hypothetical protein
MAKCIVCGAETLLYYDQKPICIDCDSAIERGLPLKSADMESDPDSPESETALTHVRDPRVRRSVAS